MDVLVSGREREPLRLPAPPAGLVLAAALLVLLAGLLSVVPVRQAEQRAADVSDVEVHLRLLDSTREFGGSLYGTLAVVVRDPRRAALRVTDVEVEVPGLHHAPARRLLPAVVEEGELVVPLRFVVPTCGALALPGQVVLQAARGERPLRREVRPVSRTGPVDGSPLLVACGRLPQPG